jgi:hypothetical protein
MRTIQTAYTFNKTAQTVTLTAIASPVLSRVLLITDQTNQTIIYDPSTVGKGGSLSGNVLTLAFDTTGGTFNNSDTLQIFYDDGNVGASETGELNEILRSLQLAILTLNANLSSSLIPDAGGRARVSVDLIGSSASLQFLATLDRVQALRGYGLSLTQNSLVGIDTIPVCQQQINSALPNLYTQLVTT